MFWTIFSRSCLWRADPLDIKVDKTENLFSDPLSRLRRSRICVGTKKVKSGEYDKVDNPLKNAPHTHVELSSNKWEHKYEREEAAYPSEILKTVKYWPPVARVDNVYGDKNIFCTCPSMDEFKEDAA